jgi:hypothetical protein
MKPEDKAKVQQAQLIFSTMTVADDIDWVRSVAELQANALRQLLEQPAPVQEPDAVVTGYYGGKCVVTPTDPARVFNTGTVFYTQPADHSEQHLDMVRALDALLVVQDEPCSIDHHGYCQSHYLDNVNSYGGCRVANARALVAKVRGKP